MIQQPWEDKMQAPQNSSSLFNLEVLEVGLSVRCYINREIV